jgi:hypothetical protein
VLIFKNTEIEHHSIDRLVMSRLSHPVATATINAPTFFYLFAVGRKFKPPAMRVIIDALAFSIGGCRSHLPVMLGRFYFLSCILFPDRL